MAAASDWLRQADGVTISGGEPFDQPEALKALLESIRSHTNVDILVYSGHAFEALETRLPTFAGLIDALISDPYDRNAVQTLALRGSDNQRLHFLTQLGRSRFAEFGGRCASAEKRFDVMMDDNGTVWLAGIPGRGDFARLKHLLVRDGHLAVTTEDTSARGPAGIET